MSVVSANYRHYGTSMLSPQAERVLELVRKRGLIRPYEMDELGIPRKNLQRLYERGVLRRLGRGIYTLLETEPSPGYSLAEACKRVPHGVICLLSALRFHDLGTQNPFEVWMAIRPKAH